MTWQRQTAVEALAAALNATLATSGLEATVFDKPPFTLNPDSIVISRVTEAHYSASAFGIDEVTLPVVCVGGQDQDETVGELLALVRATVDGSLNLDGAVQQVHAVGERNWRHVNVAGTDLLAAELTLQILM